MAEPLLLLRLEAPMQSWGVRARWDVRDTAREPSKSGVIGLIGCALGLARDDPRLEQLDAELRFGVRTDRPGIVAVDYHTVSGRHRMANGRLKPEEYTVQSWREYLHDAAFLVALAGEPGRLSDLAGALMSPHWPLYLGRKSCVPARPVLDGDAPCTHYADLESALRKAPWSAPVDPGLRRDIGRTFAPDAVPAAMEGWVGQGTWVAAPLPHALEAWIEDPAGPVERQDAMRLNALRAYEFRRCRRMEVPVADLEVLST